MGLSWSATAGTVGLSRLLLHLRDRLLAWRPRVQVEIQYAVYARLEDGRIAWESLPQEFDVDHVDGVLQQRNVQSVYAACIHVTNRSPSKVTVQGIRVFRMEGPGVILVHNVAATRMPAILERHQEFTWIQDLTSLENALKLGSGDQVRAVAAVQGIAAPPSRWMVWRSAAELGMG